MTTEQTRDLELEIRIEAPPEIVYSYFVDPVKMTRWKGKSATLDARPGGIYRVDVTGSDVARGEYVEITPFSRVVFTWGWEEEGNPVPPGSSTVEISLLPDGAETVVRLRHYGLTAEQGEKHAEGWEHYLERLAPAAEGRDPGADPWAS